MKLVITEAESPGMRAFVERRETAVASLVARVEVRRAVARAGEVTDPFERALEHMTLLPVDVAIADRASSVGPPALRALDAIHLATALEFGAELDAFVTYDERLARAATELGLTVVSPR